MAIDTGPYLRALEEMVGFKLGEPADENFDFVVDGVQTVSFRLDGKGETAGIVCLVDKASSRLPRAALARLLEFNFPANSTAGAAICATGGTHNLKLVNNFPLRSISPEALAQTALAQGRAAIAVAKALIELTEKANR